MKATAFYKRSCDGKYTAGCANYAIMLENGRGVAKDLEAAASLHDRACREGATGSCQRRDALRDAGTRD